MREECMALLAPRRGGIYVDATLGLGGHAAAILAASAPDGRLIGMDRDPHALTIAKQNLREFGPRATLVRADFAQLRAMLLEMGVSHVHGLIADLGVSSLQLDSKERGFAFRYDAPLDMRMSATRGQTAEDVLASLSEGELADVLWRYGEERRSRAIARAIVKARARGDLTSTAQLAAVVLGAVGRYGKSRVHPATRTFQALRIYVNEELQQLERLLEDSPNVLCEGGVVVILSFHSLEDRMVKRAFRDAQVWHVLTKKPLTASLEERQANPRSRSAKLRAARRLGAEEMCSV
ncbi:MAG: 16S rRNA (cytosine(1402)-N(4))-methyltransferase RsmH [Myxococcales bacterium]|nr:16S rRNA (cytosine(1402)-N(4))-methyltransferase RsmH [Myxococcales bacterium]